MEKHKTFDELKAVVLIFDEQPEGNPEKDPQDGMVEDSEENLEEDLEEDPEDPEEEEYTEDDSDPNEDQKIQNITCKKQKKNTLICFECKLYTDMLCIVSLLNMQFKCLNDLDRCVLVI